MRKTVRMRTLHALPKLLIRTCMLLTGLFTATSSQATDFFVTSLANSGAGTLRTAITAANADASGPHNIIFNVSGNIVVTTSLPTIIKQVTIDGNNTITISGPGGDNLIGLIVLGAGSGGSIIRNMALRNTGLEPVLLTAALSNITLEKLTMSQTGTHYANHAIMANGAVTNLTIKDVTVTGTQDNWWGILFNSTVTNLMIDGYRMSGGGGGTARGIQFQAAVNGATIKNSLIDMDDPATTNDGDYAIICNAAVNNLTIDSSTFRDAEVYPIYFKGSSNVTNFTLKNSSFDNLDGGTTTQMVRFETTTNANTITIDKNTFNADYRNTADDGDYGVVLGSVANQNINITNNTFIEHDGSGLHVAANHAANTDNLTISGNTFTKNGNGLAAQGGMRIYVRNATSDMDSVRIRDNTFNANNGAAINVYAANNVSSTVAKFIIHHNRIYSTQSAIGAIQVNLVNKVVISANSIYNNVGLGIQLNTGNCNYEGVNTPQIISSTETTPGTYDLQVKMPAICGSGNCSLEIFSNEAKVTGTGGQHYVTTRTGLASGTQTLTGVTGSFPETNGAPYGTWSATLKLNNNCGTSEFGNKLRVKIVGPAGVNNGIKLWLRGDEILSGGSVPSASGQLISGWDELSGAGAPSSTTIVNNPLTKLNGINFNPVADMDGDVIRGILPNALSWITSNALTTVAVFNPQSISAVNDRFFVLYSQSGIDYNTNGAQIEFYRAGDNIQSYRGNTLLNPPIHGLTGVKAFNIPGIFSSVTSGTNHTSYYNAVNMGSGNYNKGNFSISQWFVGGGYGPVGSGVGWYYGSETDFAEVFTYNRVLSATELQRVQSYMALKYGIAMKQNYVLSNDAVVWDVAANAAFSKEIAALVKDNVSILEQKQAKAFHTDEVVTIGIGGIAATNKENEGTVTNDLSVLIWGNDSASTAFTQAFTGSFANTRMVRKWKVQKTNWADQDITLQLKNGKATNYLLISTDPTFATVSQELPLNADGTITISSSLLTNGGYFTFGRQQKAPGGVLTGLEVWTKADEGVTMTGTNATSWDDQGPSMRTWNRLNTNLLNWEPAAMNYNPAIRFPGPTPSPNYFSFSPQFTNTYTQGEVFSVQSSTVNSVEGFPWQLGGNSGTTPLWYRYTTENMYLHFGTNTRRNFAMTGKNMNVPVILNANTAANSWTTSLDGKIFSGPLASPTVFAQTGTNNAIGVAYASYFNGPISEVILYKRKLNATERQQVNSYMALRYGITLDQTAATDYLASDGTTTMWKASDNGAYKINIAGIGRDDNGALLQKQSRSINTTASGNLVAIAVGNEIAATNTANTDTITNDKSFLAWADNNGAITYTTSVTGEKATLRMARVWKVDKTNWADRNITIKLHGSVSNGYLLISNTDAAFATIDRELPINADSTITINTTDLPDGAYFTFAKEIKGPGYVNAGVQFWLRADDAVSTPAVWNDFSGNDNNATQATTANQPVAVTNSVNFNPGFDLDGANDFMNFATNGGISGTNQFTILSVTKRGSLNTTDAILAQANDATNGFINYFTGGNKYAVAPTGATGIASTGTYTTVNVPMLNATTRAASNLFNLYTNGVADGSGTVAMTFLANNLRIGVRGGGFPDWFDGNINELVVYNRALPADQLQQASSYLAFKYGLTLNNGASDYIATDGLTKMWTVSKNGIYNKNIAGIGRDDKTGLFQKQSRSVSDTLITIAAGSIIATDNASNTANIADLSFLAWANDNGLTTFSVAVTGVPNTTSRMARVWKVDRTNWTDQDITIKVAPGGERYLLVHTTDPAFGAGTVEHAINTLTGTVTINSADLPDGAFFTIGTKIVGPGCVNNGIVTWLRSDYAAGVDSWIDFSGNQVSAAQATVANQPALLGSGLNYNPALSFAGADYLQIPQASITGKYSTGNAARTLIGVGFTTGSPADQLLMSYGSFVSNQASGLRVSSARSVFEGSGVANGVVGPLNSVPANKSTIMSGRYTGGATGTASIYTNSLTAGASGTMNWNTVLSAQGAQIGKYVGETRYWNGSVGEVIVYNRDLTDPEFQRVSSYLALKYGITLDQTTPSDYVASDGATKMWTAADNTGYNLRITGIGRDDCTSLYQKQSLSTDAGTVAIALGDSVATSNIDNAHTIDNDNAYLVFADNNAATQYTTPVSGLASVTTRMPRIWKVDKTNFADADISFKLTGGNDKIYLVVSAADDVFDGSDVAYQLNETGTVTINTADLPDGAYFTFARQLNGPGYVNTGIQLWLRADDGASNNETWYDYSGNDNNAIQASAGLQPTLTTGVTNYNPGFVFDGTKYMTLDISKLPVGTSARTLVGVGTPSNVTGARYMMGWGAATASQYSALANNGTTGYFLGWSNDVSAANLAALNQPEELFGTWAGSGGLATLYSKMSNAASANKVWTTGTSAGAHIGRLSDNTSFWIGSLGELVVYNRVLTDEERLRVSSYLALKYGYTMDQTTPNNYVATDWNGSTGTIYWNGTTNAAYNKNIAGIGRDDKTGLYQKQSRSVNTTLNGNMVAIGLTSIEVTNNDNTATIDDDMSFLVWGDNGLTLTQTTEFPASLNPGGCSKITRLQREWKVQKTGTINSVQMVMYLAGQVPSSTSAGDLKLLVDDDGDFGNGGTTIIDPAGYDAATQQVTFDNVSLNNGQYFTLVTDLTNQAPGGVTVDLHTWYRGDKGVTLGTGVGAWADQSSSGKDATQATGAAQPVYNTTTNLINFNPTLSFDGSNDVLSNNTINHTGSNSESMFAVVLPDAVAGVHNFLGLSDGATNTSEFRLSANKLTFGAAAPYAEIANTNTTDGIVQLAEVSRALSGAATLRMNGTALAAATLPAMYTMTYLNIGARRSGSSNDQFFKGRIAEVAIYNSGVTPVQRTRIISYLAIKYGITLPVNYTDPAGTVVWNTTTNTGFGFNITGISRDDCNGLHQKQSRSVNTAQALVTIGHGLGISTTNAGNTNTMANNTALLFGDDNADRTAFTATSAPSGRERLTRLWKVQETGTVGTVTIQVPANSSAAAVKLPLERDGGVYLLVNSTSNFTSGTIEVPMTLNGDNWEATYDFTTGDYFTFATNDICVSTQALLTIDGGETVAATEKCYVNGWILFKDPVDQSKYIAGIYDPTGLIDRSLITARIDVNGDYADLGKGNATQASRLMRRLLQIDCASCFDAVANPAPAFTVRMFYSTAEKAGAESGETNSMEALKTANGITDPHSFKWFKARGKTAEEVISSLAANGIGAWGDEWIDGLLPTGQVDGVDYIDFTNINGFSTFGGVWLVNVQQALPVTWLNVQAAPVDDRTILVKWGTATETNNAGFEVERSEDGVHFQSIAQVAGTNTSTNAYYSVNDNQVQPGVKYYYRIKQTDLDGHSGYSKIVSAMLGAAGRTVQVKPNPVKDILRAEITVDRSQKLQAVITDVTGKILSQQLLTAQPGFTSFTTNVSGYANGTYLLHIKFADGTVKTDKFIIQKGL